MLIALRKKMRAKLLAMMHETPAALMPQRRMFAGGAAAEVFTGDDDVPFLHLLREPRIGVFHAVRRQFGGVAPNSDSARG